MQNRTDLVGLSLPQRVKQILAGQKALLTTVGAALAGYVMANSTIFGGAAPFGVALCAALWGRYSIGAACGAVLGYVITPYPLTNLKYIAAVLVVVAVQWLLSVLKKQVQNIAVWAAATTFGALLLAGITVVFTDGATIYDLLLSGAEILLGCGGAYFFARTVGSLRVGWVGANRADLSCLIISFAVAVMGLSTFYVGGLSVGRMLSVLVILLCARYGGEAGGAVSGITAGIAMGLAGGDYAYAISAYGFGGMIAGVFGSLGRIPAGASFILINTVTALFTKSTGDVYTSIFEIFIASVLFVAIPQSWAGQLRLGRLSQAAQPDNTTQAALQHRMGDISGALKDISATTRKVTEKLGKLESSGTGAVYTRVAERVCYHCGMKTTCWQFKYNDTIDALTKAMQILKREGTINKDRLPKHFAQTCCKLDNFISELNTQFGAYVAREGVQLKVSKVRAVITDQFDGMAMMIDEIADELCNIRFMHPQKAEMVQQYFEKEGISASQIRCSTDEYDRMSVEVTIPNFQVAKLKKTKSTLDLCTLMDAEFDLPQLTQRQSATTVLYCEKATFTVQVGSYQIASKGNRLCGDALDFIRNQSGKAHFFLSDGMGSGGSAAVDSSMTCGLFSRLVSVGVSHEAALKLVNSALLIKSGEESLATVDICSLDLFTGRASFYKAGAAPTFLIRSGKAGYIESTSLPVGILRGVAFEKSGMTLHAGDVIVMVSDGVIATGVDWIKSELEMLKGCQMQQLSEKLALTAKERRTDGHEDDITVLAVALEKGI